MGCVFKHKDRKLWWIKYTRGGKVYYESSRSKRRGDATKLLQRREGDIANGKPVTSRLGRVTFDDAIKNLLADYRNRGAKSLRLAELRINRHLMPCFGGRRLADITTADIRAYIAQRQERGSVHHRNGSRRDVAAATINRELTWFKRAFRLAASDGLIFHVPHIPMLGATPARAGFLDAEQLATVIRHLSDEVRPVVQFAAVTGWRIESEVLPLQWRNVDFNAGEVRLDPGTTKNREGRVFPFTSELRRILTEQNAKHEKLRKSGVLVPHVFYRLVADVRGGEKKPRPFRSIRKLFDKACRKAGCPGRIPHDLRRTAVRTLVRAGVPERVCMELTGHKTRSIFERYNITSAGDLRDAARRLDTQFIEANGSVAR